jgi:methyltransferase (TIGR00027 family)
MEENKPSRSALVSVIRRAIHQLYDDDPKIFVDPPGVRLAEETDPALFATLRDARSTPLQTLIRAQHVVRCRFAEDELTRSVTRGITQYVLLGAGLDTFAFRQPPFARALRIFEVDHPATQAWKRERLAALELSDPPNLCWAPLDFERETLAEGLAVAGFDFTRPSFFSWLGVTMYLTRAAIDTTLGVVAALPAPSTITLTFTLPDDDLAGIDLELAQTLAQSSAKAGEPWLSRFHPDELRGHLLDLGFSSVFYLTPPEVTTRYLSGRQDGLRSPEAGGLMSATV